MLNALYSAIVTAHESHQHEQAARVLDAYACVLAHAHPRVASRIRRDLAAMRPLLDQMPASPSLADARRRVDTAVPVGTPDGHSAAEPAQWPRAAQGARVP